MSAPADAADRPSRSGFGLTLLLVLVMGLALCEPVADYYQHYVGKSRVLDYIPGLPRMIILIVRDVGAGLLIDAIGVKRSVALAIAVWCALAFATGSVTDALALRAFDVLAIGAYVVRFVGFYAAIRLARPMGRTALPVAIVDTSTYLWAAVLPVSMGLFRLYATADLETTRQWQTQVCAAAGLLILLVWVLFFRDVRPPGAPSNNDTSAQRVASLLRHPLLWPLAALVTFATLANHVLFQEITPYLKASGLGAHIAGDIAVAPHVVAWIGAIIAAIVSDRRLRRTHSLDHARRSLVIAGFLLAALLAAVPLLPVAAGVFVACLAAIGVGLQILVPILVMDVAPRHSVGTMVGLTLAATAVGDAITNTIVFILRAHVPAYAVELVLAGVVSLAGAALAARFLRDIEAPDGSLRAAIHEVFT